MPQSSRRRLAFRLRTLFGVLSVCAVFILPTIRKIVLDTKARQRADDWLDANGGTLTHNVDGKVVAIKAGYRRQGTLTNFWKIPGHEKLGRKNDGSTALGGARVTDLKPLRSFKQLRELDITEPYLLKLDPVRSITTLESLKVRMSFVVDPSPLSSLSNLRHLELNDLRVAFPSLRRLSELRELHLSGRLSDLSPLESLNKLEILAIAGKAGSLLPLRQLNSLRELRLCEANVTDVKPLKGLVNLKKLDLSRNRIRDITALAGLVSLEELDLGFTQVRDISPLSGLKRLRKLRLVSTHLITLAPLGRIKSLNELNVHKVRLVKPDDKKLIYSDKLWKELQKQLAQLRVDLPDCDIRLSR